MKRSLIRAPQVWAIAGAHIASIRTCSLHSSYLCTRVLPRQPAFDGALGSYPVRTFVTLGIFKAPIVQTATPKILCIISAALYIQTIASLFAPALVKSDRIQKPFRRCLRPDETILAASRHPYPASLWWRSPDSLCISRLAPAIEIHSLPFALVLVKRFWIHKPCRWRLRLVDDTSYARAKALSCSANVHDRIVLGSFKRATLASIPTVPWRFSTRVQNKLTPVE